MSERLCWYALPLMCWTVNLRQPGARRSTLAGWASYQDYLFLAAPGVRCTLVGL